jgi:toxin ParE1/3/4
VNSVIRPRARDDIIRQFRWYLIDQEAPEAALRFLDAIEDSVEQIVRMPNMGAPKTLRNPALEGLRAWPVKGFEDIRIFYLVQGQTVRVLRILHGKRDIGRILEGESAKEDMRN